MKINADIDTLEKDIKQQIESFKKNRSKNKARAGRVVVWGAVLSAITTILVSISSFFQDDLNKIIAIAAIVTNSSLAILYAWDGLFNHKRLWIIYADTLTKLYELKDDVKHTKATNPDNLQKIVNYLYEEYKKALKASNENWMTLKVEMGDNNNSAVQKDEK